MALQTINIDDRTYDQLVGVLRKHIPVSEWTDHNPSDPGILLLEMLCWIGEMTLYRMNRVPATHREKFLNLLADPPQPVTVDVTFTVTFDLASLPHVKTVVIPKGTKLATDFNNGRRFVFETLSDAAIPDPKNAGDPVSQTVTARELLVVTNDFLGTSDGTPNQVFQLSPPLSLKTTPDQPLPVLLDFVNFLPSKSPNPQVTVGGVAWELHPFLLTDGSKVVTGTNPARHFMVEQFENRIRFGDDVFGAIPAAGLPVVATSYQVLQGAVALIKANSLRYVLDDLKDLKPNDKRDITHDDASGGLNVFSPDVRLARTLQNFRAPLRIITERDFEVALLQDFNDFQDLSSSTPKILRAVAMMNRKPPLQIETTALGHVTILVIIDFDQAFLQNPAIPIATRENSLALDPSFERKIRRFLDDRRLITTRLHFATPGLLPLDITASVVVFNDRNVAQMEDAIRKRFSAFFSILHGDFDGRGWRLGRDVYRSQIFRVLEEMDGVDYVTSLSMTPANSDGNVTIGPHQLPLLQNLFLTVARG